MMKPVVKFRFTMAQVMMLVVTTAAASALFAKVLQYSPVATKPYLKIDAPVLFTVSIGLTALALGALKNHSAVQMMLQTTLACLGYFSLFVMAENHWARPLLYWFQGAFALQVALPMLARNAVKTGMERGPRRDWWKKTFEAVIFSFLTMLLVVIGILLQWIAVMVGSSVLKF